jgi:RNA polymerase sigma-70 factor (ECF subfamily)
MRIAINLATDYQRSRRLQFWRALVRPSEHDSISDAVESFMDNRASAERALIARQQVERVWRAASKLSSQQRSVFLLRFVDEMEIAEIAQVIGLAEGTVKVHLSRAVGAVRKVLREGQEL